MSRRTERLADEVGLQDLEREYLAEVDRHSAGVPGGPRRRFLTETAETLAERPPGATWDDLEEALGSPRAAVQEWREAEGFDRWVSPWSRWWSMPAWVRVTQVVVLVGVALAGFAAWRYYTAEPTILNSCGGVAASESESLEAAGESEYRVPFPSNERLGVILCPYTLEPDVRFDRVHVSLGRATNFQPVGWEVSTGADLGWTGDAGNHRSWRTGEAEGGWGQVMLWFEMAHCLQEGSRIGFDRVWVDYHYRGRDRSVEVPLTETVTVVGTADCTDERRASDHREVEAWSAVTDPLLYPRPAAIEPLGPLELDPFNVSDDLCRYLRGVVPVDGYEQLEPLEARAVFQLEDTEMAATLIDGAVLGICPEFADQRDRLLAMLDGDVE